jgi:hypothetical protein
LLVSYPHPVLRLVLPAFSAVKAAQASTIGNATGKHETENYIMVRNIQIRARFDSALSDGGLTAINLVTWFTY